MSWYFQTLDSLQKEHRRVIEEWIDERIQEHVGSVPDWVDLLKLYRAKRAEIWHHICITLESLDDQLNLYPVLGVMFQSVHSPPLVTLPWDSQWVYDISFMESFCSRPVRNHS